MIDTNGFDITIAQALVHSNVNGDNAVDGGLVKNGTGILSITGESTYTGNTVVNAGTLVLGGAASLSGGTSTTVASGAALQLDSGSSYKMNIVGLNSNTISGSGTVTLDGQFVFDLSGASMIEGNTWLVENVLDR